MKFITIIALSLISVNLLAQTPITKQDVNDAGEEFYEAVENINHHSLPAHSSTNWFKEMSKKQPNVRKAQNLYNVFVKKYPFYHSKNRTRFEIWMNNALLNMDKLGNSLPFPQTIITSVIKPVNSLRRGITTDGITTGTTISASPTNVGTWRMLGPNNLDPTIGACGNSTLVSGGFVDRPYINPYNTNNMFAGMSYGGLWVTKDAGLNWSLTDATFSNGTNTYANRDYYYGDIKANTVNPQLIYCATEAGLLKSIDGGLNWTLSTIINRTATLNVRPYYVAQATDNQNVVLTTFGRKLYRSSDAGVTWTVVFDNTNGGANHTFSSQYNFGTPFGINDRTYNFFGLQESYENSNNFYVGVWNASNEACIYKSTDGGANWVLLTNLNTSLSVSWNSGTSLILKTTLGSPSKFFVVPQFTNPSTYYRFNNTGTLASSNAINNLTEAFDIDWYNENTVYVSGYFSGYSSSSFVQKSIDGGVTIINPITGCGWLHPDMRGISAVGNKVLLANDGGLGYSDDGCANIRGTGFQISSPDVWGFSSSQRGDRMLAGLDHNQTFVRSFDGNGGWKNIKGADAGPCSINAGDDHWLYYDWAYGVNKAYINDAGNLVEYGSASGIGYSSLVFHPYYLFNMFGISGTRILQSNDNLSSTTVFKDFGSNQNINKICIARRDPKTMYALINNSNINQTIDSGITWHSISPTTVQSNGQTNISSIEVGKLPGELWATYGNIQTSAKVLYSTNGGSSWANITSTGLPSEPVGDISYQRGTSGCVYVFINTLNGAQVWYKDNTMATWQQLGNNLPTMGYLRDKMVVVPQKGVIRLGSSRGSWEQALSVVSKPEASFSVENHISDCSTLKLQFHDASAFTSGNTSLLWTFPGGTPSTSTDANPLVAYTGTAGAYDATLAVTDANGNTDQFTANNIIQVKPNLCMIDLLAGNAMNPINTVVTLDTVPIKSNTFTISMWTKPHGLQNVFSQLLATDAPNTRFGIGISFPGYNKNLNLTFRSPSDSYGQQTNINLVDGVWNHIALTYSPSGVLIYLNGNTPWSFPISNPSPIIDFTQSTLKSNVDINDGQGSNYNGDIDEVKFYNRVLSQNEIRESMNLINPNGEAGLVSYYQFNQYNPVTSNLYEATGKAASPVPASAITVSDAPIATGISQRLPNVTAPGFYGFTVPGLGLTFSGPTVPNGEVVVSRLYAEPFNPLTNFAKIAPSYWIVRNYGSNQTFDPVSIKFDGISVSVADANNPVLLQMAKRPSNSLLLSDWGAGCGATSAVAGNPGSILFGSNCNTTSFSQFLLATNGTSVLPLQFIEFAAISVNNINGRLNWTTANEVNNKKIIVQRSVDGTNWINIGETPSQGTGGFKYEFIDRFPLNGKNFYRLMQVDIDGKSSFSAIRTISIGVQEAIVIQPNPSNTYFLITGCRNPLDEVQLYEIEGKKEETKSSRQSESVVRVETSSLPNGTYILMIRERGFKIVVLHDH